MKWVEPEVYFCARTDTYLPGPQAYLDDVGAPDWTTDAKSDGEKLIEIGGRMCYRAFDPSLNKNLTKIREGNLAYIQNIVKQGHGSVLEHASCTFIFRNVSRVFTHELVRHRAGCAYSQESLRYVALDDIPFVDVEFNIGGTPEEMRQDIRDLVHCCENLIAKWRGRFIDDETTMKRKKEITSFLRRLAPIGLGTSIMFTANLRALRHLIELRTAPGAETEIRTVFDRVAGICCEKFPAVFADFTRGDDGTWTPKYSKV